MGEVNMSEQAYKEIVEYRFAIRETWFAITGFGDDWVEIEETRKSGHEDTHMSGILVKQADGKFAWEEGESMFRDYGWDALPDEIRAYLDANGIPKAK